MERLIEIMNKLQDLSNTSGMDLPTLPQIVVIGEQSSGKSSVLESLVKQPILPRGEGLVTRCPIVLQLIHTPRVGSRLRDGYDSDEGSIDGQADEWCEFLHRPNDVFLDFEEARKEILAQVNRIAGSNKGIVKERITVKVFSPRVLTLTVVDLPGLVKVPIGDQPEDIEDQVRSMVESFIEDPKTIILAVCTAVQDIAASEAIKFSKNHDPEGLRTIVVLTKLDMMSQGSNCEDTLRGRTLPVKLGIVGVVNRSPKENRENKSIKNAIDDEEAFLRRYYPSLASRNGSRYLGKKLQKILMDHIRRWMPEMLKQVDEKTLSARQELSEYGEAPKSKRKILLELINDFSATVDTAINGKSRCIPKTILLGGERINHVFDNVLKNQLETVDPDDIPTKEILITVANSEGIENFSFNPEKAFRELVKDKILQLEYPVMKCAERAHTEMMKLVRICFKGLGQKLYRFPNLVSAIRHEVNAMLETFYEDVKIFLKQYVFVQASFTHTPLELFKNEMEALVKQAAISKAFMGINKNGREVFIDEGEDDEMTYSPEINEVCLTVKKLIREYFKVIQTSFKDFIPKALMFYMVHKLQDNLRTILTEKLYSESRIDHLMEEKSEVAGKREDTKRRLEALDEAAKILVELRDSESGYDDWNAN